MLLCATFRVSYRSRRETKRWRTWANSPYERAVVYAQSIIEITLQPDGRVPAELLKEAYRASIRGKIVFVLQNVSPGTIDEILDDIVPLLPLEIPGVLYIDISDENKVAEAVLGADRVFADTEKFRSILARLGVRQAAVRPVTSALEALKVQLAASDTEPPSIRLGIANEGAREAPLAPDA